MDFFYLFQRFAFVIGSVKMQTTVEFSTKAVKDIWTSLNVKEKGSCWAVKLAKTSIINY